MYTETVRISKDIWEAIIRNDYKRTSTLITKLGVFSTSEYSYHRWFVVEDSVLQELPHAPTLSDVTSAFTDVIYECDAKNILRLGEPYVACTSAEPWDTSYLCVTVDCILPLPQEEFEETLLKIMETNRVKSGPDKGKITISKQRFDRYVQSGLTTK